MAEEHARTGPLLLLDGMSLAFRAYYALPDTLATRAGVVTNAVHGFSSMLVYLIREQRPSALAVAFDAPGDTFRDEMLEDYKAGRAATPWLLPPQFDIIREVMDSLAIPVIEAPGFEADDVIATLATQAAARDCEVVIVTGDRDSFQLVRDPYIRVLYNKRGVSDYTLYDEAGIFERTGVAPEKYVLLAALRGDPSDNLPGVPGVGEKTAAKLLTNYGDLDGIYSHLGDLTPKLRENLAANEHLARSNERIIPLVLDVPLDVDVSQLELGGWDAARAEATFEQYEMRTVWQRLAELVDAGALGEPLTGSVPRPGLRAAGENAAAGHADAPPDQAPLELRDVALPTTPAEAAKQLGELGGGRLAVAGRWNGLPGRSDLVALLILATDGDAAGLGVLVPGEHLAAAAVVKELNTLLAQPVLGHNVKELMRSLLPLGIDIEGLEMDTAVAAYLLDASTGEYQLQQLREQTGQLALEIVEAGETAADLAKEAAGEASDVYAMAHSFRTRITADDMVMLHDGIETPLVRVLARMEVAGIGVDRAELQSIADSLKASAATLQDEVQKIAGHEFNVNSTPQLRTVLFEELGLTPGKKTKTGFSTDAQTLEKMRDDHPIIEALLDYREVEKLRSTYGESLLAEVQGDDRIHASFGQTVARTGRISSDRPNLHNIPVRSDLGKQFRRAFVPGQGSTFLVADYDQVELRCIAHLSEDPGLIDAMTSGADVHRTVAAAVYGIPPEEVTHTQREFCKMVSYGLAYGMEAYGLSQRLGVAVEEAAAIMESYFGAFPLVKQYMDATVADAKIRGATRTQFGRIRPLPDLQAANYRVRQAAERQAMNAGIQGLAADIFKLALVRLDRDLEEAKLSSRLVLQVHDEVIVEVPAGEEEDARRLTESALTSAADLKVPLTISVATGPSWAAAKG
ncbi:MAG TPA: DNA polymerase I [Acidimicrobiales bacterium]|nr:DNA polymerase I [Acidimicrobiales bacterium]